MGISEPSSALWAAVKAVYDSWPPDDEGVAQQLSTDWGDGAEVVTTSATAAESGAQAAVQEWQDPAGVAFGDSAAQRVQTLRATAPEMTAMSTFAGNYAQALTGMKTAVVATIAVNEAAYAMLGAVPAVGPAAQGMFANAVAQILKTLTESTAANLAGMAPAQAGPAAAGPGGGIPAQVAAMEQALRDAGLLTGPVTDRYRQWLENAVRRGVPLDTIKKIITDHGIKPEDFAILDRLEEVREDADGDGIFKSYFLLPTDISGEDAAKAVRMTYILNAGTDYGAGGQQTDFAPTPYGSDELRRITERQQANSWSYNQDVGFVHGNGGRLATTPNGMMMGLGGNVIQDVFSQRGGTAWGDTFMLNIDDPEDPAQQLRQVASSGRAWYVGDNGPYQGDLDLDRLLHHEERHSQQWAREGYGGFLTSYAWEQLTGGNETEEDAGLGDGGYHD